MFLCFTVGLASGNKIYHFNPPSPSTPYYYPGTKVPVHPPPYDQKLFRKKEFLNVPLTMALCRKYNELRRLKPCARAIQNMQRGILPSCPLSDNNRWPSNTSQQSHTRTKRSFTPLPECTASQPNAITVTTARDSSNPNKNLDIISMHSSRHHSSLLHKLRQRFRFRIGWIIMQCTLCSDEFARVC
ncbi:uncharacterized protein LOC144411684 [Styela clava]